MCNHEARDLLVGLLKLDLGNEIGYDEFRCRYEEVFNFELERASVSPEEFVTFQRLFDTVVWYSPFPEERAAIPNYVGEDAIDAVVEEARRVLGIVPPGKA